MDLIIAHHSLSGECDNQVVAKDSWRRDPAKCGYRTHTLKGGVG